MKLKIMVFICIFLVFSSIGCTTNSYDDEPTELEREILEGKDFEVIEENIGDMTPDTKLIDDNFTEVGKIKISLACELYVYYEEETDLLLYRQWSPYGDAISVVCLSTIPEPQQSIIRKKYKI